MDVSFNADAETLLRKRKTRIAKGAGRKLEEVNQLMKQFDQMSKMMKMMQGPGGKNMMKRRSGMK